MTDETKSKIRYVSSLVALFILAAAIEIGGLILLAKHSVMFAMVAFVILTIALVVGVIALIKILHKSYSGEDKEKIKVRFILTLAALVLVALVVEFAGMYFMIKHPTAFAVITFIILTAALVFGVIVLVKIINKSYKMAKEGKVKFTAFASVKKENKKDEE